MWRSNNKNNKQKKRVAAPKKIFNKMQQLEFKLKLAKIFSANYHVEIDDGLVQVNAKNKHWKQKSKFDLTDIDLSVGDLVEFLLYKVNTAKYVDQSEVCKLSLKLIKHRYITNNKLFLSDRGFYMERSMINDLAKAFTLLSINHDDSIAKLARKVNNQLLRIVDVTTESTNPEWGVIQQINNNIVAIKTAIKNLEENNAHKAIQDISNFLSVTSEELERVNILIAHNSKVDASSAEEIIRIFSIIQSIIFSEYHLAINFITVLNAIVTNLNINITLLFFNCGLIERLFLFLESIINELNLARLTDTLENILASVISYLHGSNYDTSLQDKFSITVVLLKNAYNSLSWQTCSGLKSLLQPYIDPAPEDYILDRKIQEGGCGTVYLYQHKNKSVANINSPLALKTMHKKVNNQSHEFMLIEIAILKTLSHSNIISLFSSQIEQDKPLGFFMPYAKAGALIEILRKNREPLSNTKLLTIALAIARALEYIHESGFVYCDLKTDNILLMGGEDVSMDSINSIKLADFGLVKSCAEKDRNVQGTYLYYSPELASDFIARSKIVGCKVKGNTVASDIWALALVFCELVKQDLVVFSRKGREYNVCYWLMSLGLDSITKYYQMTDDNHPPEVLKSVTNNCFNFFVGQRPGASEVRERLEQSMLPNPDIS